MLVALSASAWVLKPSSAGLFGSAMVYIERPANNCVILSIASLEPGVRTRRVVAFIWSSSKETFKRSGTLRNDASGGRSAGGASSAGRSGGVI